MDAWDKVVDMCSNALPKFNKYTLRGYRQQQIAKIPKMLDMIFGEAVKRFGVNERGEPTVKYIGHRFLAPEEVIASDAQNPKYSNYVEVLRTEQTLAEFEFEYGGDRFFTPIYIPHLSEDALIVNGSKYYVMFALTDKIFYHIVKNPGIGIKILCAHLRFWRMFRYSIRSTRGEVYGDQILGAKIHLREYQYTADDLQTALILYPLVKFGLKGTLERYGIDPSQIQIVTDVTPQDEDLNYGYFWIPITADEEAAKWNGIFLKVHNDILAIAKKTNGRIKIQIVVALHYILTYFSRCKSTIYTDRHKLVQFLTEDPDFMVYKVILGKTVFGINYESEVQVAGHIQDHLQSLEIYMDPATQEKLRSIGIECKDVYDLIHYVSLHMDEYVANYFPSNVYDKQMNVLDLLLGNMVNTLFTRIYQKTNNRKGDKPFTLAQIASSLRVGAKVFNRLYLCAGLIASNPSVFNDNGLLAVLGRRKRATFSTARAGSNSGIRRKGGSDTNLLQDPEHRTHSSLYIVESGSRTQTTDPTKSGTINGFLIVDPNGNLIIPDWLKEIAATVDQYVYTK